MSRDLAISADALLAYADDLRKEAKEKPPREMFATGAAHVKRHCTTCGALLVVGICVYPDAHKGWSSNRYCRHCGDPLTGHTCEYCSTRGEREHQDVIDHNAEDGQ